MLESFLSATQTYDNLGLTPNPPLATDKPSIYGVFEGDESCSVTAYAFTPNGTAYTVCTTLQYFGYKPASNAAWLTVEPQLTQTIIFIFCYIQSLQQIFPPEFHRI